MPLFFCCPLAYWAQGVRALRRGRSGELHKGDREKEKKAILTYLALRRGNLARRGGGFREGVRTQRDNLLMDKLFMALSEATCLLCTSNPVPCLKWEYIGGRMKVMQDPVISVVWAWGVKSIPAHSFSGGRRRRCFVPVRRSTVNNELSLHNEEPTCSWRILS